MENLITVAEAAQLKGVSRSAIYKAISQGRLNARRVLGKVALDRNEVVAWIPLEFKGRNKGTPMSEEIKTKISESQKRRWARRKRDSGS